MIAAARVRLDVAAAVRDGRERSSRGAAGAIAAIARRSTLRNRTVILVDDGLATGATMRAAVLAVRARPAERVVVAVPVAPRSTSTTLGLEVDEVVCLITPEPFRGVGAWYADFEPGERRDGRCVAGLGLLGRAPGVEQALDGAPALLAGEDVQPVAALDHGRASRGHRLAVPHDHGHERVSRQSELADVPADDGRVVRDAELQQAATQTVDGGYLERRLVRPSLPGQAERSRQRLERRTLDQGESPARRRTRR